MEKTNNFIKYIAFVLLIVLLMSIASCENQIITEVITQKIVAKGSTNITILVKYAFSINEFEKAVETKFPNINIVQVGNYTSDMGVDEYYARMKNDDLTDIVMTWPLEVGEEYFDDRLLDLSGLPFTNQYHTNSLRNIAEPQNGKLYYLPGPMQVRGIVYNKTMFIENGWAVPSDYESFINLCQTIEATTDIRSLQLGLKNSEVLDTAFTGYGFGNSFSSPKSVNALKDFDNQKQGVSFGDNFSPALNTFKELLDKGVLKKGDLDIDYSEREKMLFSRKCAMIEDSALMARMGGNFGSNDEFALMPFFNPGVENDWARLYPVCYIGVNKHLAEPANKNKYDLVMKLLDFISSKEGQQALSGDTGAMFSHLKDISAPDVVEIKDLVNTLNQGRYGIFPTLKNAQRALREGLASLIKGDITDTNDIIKLVDNANKNPQGELFPASIGEASESFTLTQTGNFVTDAMRKASGCDVALFLDNGTDGTFNGKGLSGKLYKGNLTSRDIKRILPDVKSKEKIEMWKVTMTGENLLKTLEYASISGEESGNWFYYFSGLRMYFDPLAKAGERISRLSDSNGNAIVLDKIYSVAIMDETVQADFFITCEKTGILIKDILIKELNSGIISPVKDNRLIVA